MTEIPLQYSEAAIQDVFVACRWLEEVQSGLSEQLLDELDRLAGLVCHTPKMYERFSGDCRRVVLKKFDYTMVYRILPDRIQVIGVFHCRLDPMVATSRI